MPEINDIIKKLLQNGSLSAHDLKYFDEADVQTSKTSSYKKTILVTGGAGFIGSNFIHYMMDKYQDYRIINLDLLTYAGNPDNLIGIDEKRHYLVKGDIRDAEIVDKIMKKVNAVVHFAAESHVDRSITRPQEFLSTNVIGTQVLLEAAKKYKIERFVHISTDEVYGSIEEGYYKENDLLTPRSPYSASKAASDMLVQSYHSTYGLPVLITRTSNNFGPRQHPEKLIPLFISNLLEDKKIPVYGYGLNRRDWIYVDDNCAAIDKVLHKGKIGEIYNIGTHDNELSNIEIITMILRLLDKHPSIIEFVKDRPGHDFRYGIDMSKIKQLDWKHKYDLKTGLKKTVDWYCDNEWWWKKIKLNNK
ncbi:MAG: dTDP-glucose 4,6-dehydratase [Patescibacteria group bacterium]|nr:dTDP-glucose 4,6-dehydratase [Patescibacteria group bacterium]